MLLLCKYSFLLFIPACHVNAIQDDITPKTGPICLHHAVDIEEPALMSRNDEVAAEAAAAEERLAQDGGQGRQVVMSRNAKKSFTKIIRETFIESFMNYKNL